MKRQNVVEMPRPANLSLRDALVASLATTPISGPPPKGQSTSASAKKPIARRTKAATEKRGAL